jgi:hypothetical protein
MADPRKNLIPVDRRCTRCTYRWRQGAHGLCRTCERIEKEEAGFKSTALRDRERQARRDAQLAALERAKPRGTERRTVVIRGVEFDVVWDGT